MAARVEGVPSESGFPLISRTNIVTRNRLGFVEKAPGTPFSRRGFRFDPLTCITREARILALLGGEVSPKLVSFSGTRIVMEDVGEPVCEENLPRDAPAQVNFIATVLRQAGIVHRDIKRENLMVQDKKLRLIDFGWSLWPEEKFYISPIELSLSRNPFNVYSNLLALRATIKELETGN